MCILGALYREFSIIFGVLGALGGFFWGYWALIVAKLQKRGKKTRFFRFFYFQTPNIFEKITKKVQKPLSPPWFFIKKRSKNGLFWPQGGGAFPSLPRAGEQREKGSFFSTARTGTPPRFGLLS